jgi:beta-lactamase class A
MTLRRAASAFCLALGFFACSSSEDAATPPVVDGPAKADGGASGDTSCPKGLDARWTCDGSRRIRCVDDRLIAEPCADGCTPGASGESICSCGTRKTFSRWNCVPEGGRGSCAGGIDWIVDSCGTSSCATGADGVSDSCAGDGPLQKAVAALGASCGTIASGVRCGISVRDLTTNERAGYEDQTPFDSASSAKVFWTSAALFDTSVSAVEPYAKAIFAQSDNIATGHVLDLLASPDRVNTFLWQDGEVADIGFCSWNYGGNRTAKNCPDALGGDNFFTTGDATAFLARIWDRSLLGKDKTETLLSWMTLSPRKGYGGWMGTQLPTDVQKAMFHKAGWLPPEAVPGYSNANDIGIVQVPNGHAYAVAFALVGAPSQAAYDDQELPLLEYLSCRVYHAVAGDDASVCTRP